ncbi:hypothetical protein [Rickettsia sp. MEAM1 (Bemisia tabaci)]|uniref:hypothetical protein n=1 Tax=Rickettsia sp. MEAM1 (Bemisia tabaci) TaxID=1182263 RepID=UPI0012FD5D15|nr:hypothetical protein [Rickettsia sp. MEAM1 (Bemisia tabaci)]
MLLLFYKSFPVIAQYLIYTSLNLTVPFYKKFIPIFAILVYNAENYCKLVRIFKDDIYS